MKVCKTCRQNLSLDSFHSSKEEKYGVRSVCKGCVSLYDRERNKNNRDDYKVYIIRNKSDDEIIYVGSTSQSLMKRLRDHFGDMKFERGTVKMELVQDELTEAQALTLEADLISQYHTSQNIYRGYKIHEKTAKKIRQVSETFLQAVRNSNSRPIICVNTGKTYASIREAARHLGLTEPKISLVCQGKRPHTKGYKFSYL